MANPHKGEVDVTIKGQPYRLTFTANSICEVEDLLNRGWFDILSEVQAWFPTLGRDGKPKKESPERTAERLRRMKMSLLRAIFWGMLREHHPDISLKDAGSLMADAADQGGALELVSQVFERSMPDSKEQAKDGAENPPRPGAAQNANGTGMRSAETGAS